MAQVIAFRPLRKFYVRDELRTQPLNFLHNLGRHRLTSTSILRFRKICERTNVGCETLESRGNLLAQCRRKTILDLGDKDQVFPVIIAGQQVVEDAAEWFVTANHQFLALIGFVLYPGTAPLSAFVSAARALGYDAFEAAFFSGGD